jgi:hypothetical protein
MFHTFTNVCALLHLDTAKGKIILEDERNGVSDTVQHAECVQTKLAIWRSNCLEAQHLGEAIISK